MTDIMVVYGDRNAEILCYFFFQAEDGIRDFHVTGVQTCALPISMGGSNAGSSIRIYSRMGDWRRGLAGVNGVRRANGEVEELGAGTVFPARVQSYRRHDSL